MRYHVVVGRAFGFPVVEPDLEDINLVLDGIIRPWQTDKVFHCEGRKIDSKDVTWIRVFRSPNSLSTLRRAAPASKVEFMLSPHAFLSDVAEEVPLTQLIMGLQQRDPNSMAKGIVQDIRGIRSEFSVVSPESLAHKRSKFQEFKEAYGDRFPEMPSLANEEHVAHKFWNLLTESAHFSLVEAQWVGKWFLDDQDDVYGWIEKALRYTSGADWTEAARKFVELFVDPYLSFLEDRMGLARATSAPAPNITISGVSGSMIQILQGSGTATQHGPTSADSGKDIANLLRELRDLIRATATTEISDKDSTLEIVGTAIEEADKPESRTRRVKALPGRTPGH